MYRLLDGQKRKSRLDFVVVPLKYNGQETALDWGILKQGNNAPFQRMQFFLKTDTRLYHIRQTWFPDASNLSNFVKNPCGDMETEALYSMPMRMTAICRS